MRCPHCGAEVSENSKFCGACGFSMDVPSTQTHNSPEQESSIPENTLQTEQSQSAQPQTEQSQTVYPQAAQSQSEQSQTVYNQAPPYQQAGNNQNTAGYGNPQQQAFQNQASYTQPQPGNSIPSDTASPKQNKRSIAILGGIAVAAIIVIVLLFKLIFGGGKTAFLDNWTSYYNARKTDTQKGYTAQYGEVIGKFKYEEAKLIAELTGNEDDWEDDFADEMDETYEYYNDSYGDNWKVEYDVTKEKELKKSDLENYQDQWDNMIDNIDDAIDALDNNDDYSKKDIEELTDFYEGWIDKFSDMEVTKGYTLTVKMIIEGDDDRERDTDKIVVLKIGGSWVNANNIYYY